MAAADAPNVPLQQRALRTRAKILDATVESLIDDGYTATTTARVQELAGVSRGALIHHFPSKQELLMDAVAHLAVRRGRWFTEQAAGLDSPADRCAAGMGLLWSTMSGPLFAAATELWVAARTDDTLRDALVVHERRLGADARTVIAEVLGEPDPEDPTFRAALDHALQTFRGAALTALLRDDARWERRMVRATTDTFCQMMNHDPQRTRP